MKKEGIEFKKWIQTRIWVHRYHYYSFLLQNIVSPNPFDQAEKQFEQEVYKRVMNLLQQNNKDLNDSIMSLEEQKALLEEWFLYDRTYRHQRDGSSEFPIPLSNLVGQQEYFETLEALETKMKVKQRKKL